MSFRRGLISDNSQKLQKGIECCKWRSLLHTIKIALLAKYAHLPEDYFFLPKLEGDIGPRMKFNGKEALNWSHNNYLGLANHPEVRKAEAAAQCGLTSPMAARMMSGNSVHHLDLEKKLAGFARKEDAMLLNYGYQGVLSIIDALVDRKDQSYTTRKHTPALLMGFAFIWESGSSILITTCTVWKSNCNERLSWRMRLNPPLSYRPAFHAQ